jgi:uncharacterized protein YkwD
MIAQQNFFSLAAAIAAIHLPLQPSHPPAISPSSIHPTSWQTAQQQGIVKSASGISTQAGIQQQILDAHNQWRKRYNVPALTWSPQLATYAQDWANRLLREDKFEHRQNSRYGENLAWASGQQVSPQQVVNMWGNEVKDYTYATNSCKPGKVCGHYTQIVWRNTKQVGCGVARSNGKEIWVCNYNPPGNYIGQKPY